MIMRKFLLSVAIGIVSGVIVFFLSVAFLSIVLLVLRSVNHVMPKMQLAYQAAIPVAILAAICGFVITLVRTGRSGARST